MKIQFPTSDVKAALAGAMSSALGAEKQLGSQAAAQVQQLIDELYPLITAETQALLTASTSSGQAASHPAIPQTYLAVLQGCVDAAIAKLGLQEILQQRQIAASTLQAAIQILALVLKAAVV